MKSGLLTMRIENCSSKRATLLKGQKFNKCVGKIIGNRYLP